MTDLLILYVLAVVDGMFVGYRDATGRNPFLAKEKYYLRAMLSAIGLVHIALLFIGGTVALTLWLAADPVATTTSLEAVAATMRTFYLAYAGCVAVGFCAYALPSYDLRSYITISTFGMLTLLRPAVIIMGALFAAIRVGDPTPWATCVVVAVTMTALQPLLTKLGWNRFDWSAYSQNASGPATDGSA